MTRTLTSNAFVWLAYLTRRASEQLDDTAVVLESLAAEFAPYPATYSDGGAP